MFRPAAAQMSSSTGAGGRDIRVLSTGKEVMALINSLMAWIGYQISYFGIQAAHLSDFGVGRPNAHGRPHGLQYPRTQCLHPWIRSGLLHFEYSFPILFISAEFNGEVRAIRQALGARADRLKVSNACCPRLF